MRPHHLPVVLAMGGALAFLPVPASAETAHFEGITPRPHDLFRLPASVTVTRSAPPGGRHGEVIPAIYTHVTTDPDAFNTGPKPTVDYGIFIAPQALDHKEADLNYGMMVYADCRYACYAMRAGNKIAYEESASIASKYDPRTGRWGLYNGEKPLFEVDVASGELRVNGRAVEIRYKD